MQELGTIESFYVSPAGQKALRELPTASRVAEKFPKVAQKYAPSLGEQGAERPVAWVERNPSSPDGAPSSSP